MRNLRVALIQEELAWHAPEANRTRFAGLITPLEGKADLIVLPEMFTTGFTMEPSALAETMEGATADWMRRMARETGADLAGSVVIREGERFYNRLLWVRPGGEVLHYDKRHLFRMAGEEKVYSPGTSPLTVELEGWRLRPFICYDLRFPAWTRSRGLDYDAAVFTANWPARRSEHWRTLLRARAVENQCYVIGVNRVGTDGNGVTYSGDSAVIDYAGNILFEKSGSPCVHIAEFSLEGLREYREAFPAWKDADDFRLGG